MKRTHFLPVLTLGLAAWVLAVGPAHAQSPLVPVQTMRAPVRPQISPYTAIGTHSPALNYFNITRPSLETRAILHRQEAEIRGLERSADTRAEGGAARAGGFESTLPRTGHKTYFSNLSHYYSGR